MVDQKRKKTVKRHVKPNSNQVDPIQEQASSTASPKRRRVQKSKQTSKRSKSESDGSEDWAESDQESVEGEVTAAAQEDMKSAVIDIPRPKGSPFADALSPDTLEFMAQLAENNNRDFMQLNQERWHAAKQDFTDFVGLIIKELQSMDPTILVEEPKAAVYRQNRDLRFTNDLRPYKIYLSASFSRGGKKSPFAGYHIAVAPGNKTMVAAGIWQPSSSILSRMRTGIMENASLMREALSTDAINDIFGKGGLEVLESSDKLKVAPKGVAKDHPEIEMLRFKSMVASKYFDDVDVVSEGFLDKVLDVFDAVVPFVAVLNSWTG
ncbi:uncharacterized protein BYT42DRAFT_568567 [Radiomyces spectabilis]|uniref:uncharacterized protein n=1 Tax=Radiomyces spectabilis TaxID=64574 RepID=UPI002220EBDC|nr:uncharacterized protein BYT42DRAFT_568567 [Radiomyces spectabilis]KAI8379376.1 hypothetical protein BYT42DRAFT_568567 [Radiomyces spectabilis]